jgi:uncharacterized protein YndB with AHSA1/START domain
LALAVDPLIKEVFIDAPPSVVFQFLTDPAKMIRWMGIKAEIDPQPGGMYRLDPNGRDVIRGEYLEVIPDSRVVFTWGREEPGHSVRLGPRAWKLICSPRARVRGSARLIGSCRRRSVKNMRLAGRIIWGA